MNFKALKLAFAFSLIAGLTVVASPGVDEAEAIRYDQTCGTLPGNGGYGYIRVKNIRCGDGKRVAFKARRKFCAARNGCAIDPFGNIRKVYRGKVRRNGWICKVADGWEYSRIKCRKGNRFLIWRAAA